ncbi:hypothetical protein RJ55_02193 [Drechmeria coniospora]|nr:hypothetical protein RJ55_02193 [Drechmeria coniospora]
MRPMSARLPPRVPRNIPERCLADMKTDKPGSQADTARRAADTQAVHLTSFAIAMRALPSGIVSPLDRLSSGRPIAPRGLRVASRYPDRPDRRRDASLTLCFASLTDTSLRRHPDRRSTHRIGRPSPQPSVLFAARRCDDRRPGPAANWSSCPSPILLGTFVVLPCPLARRHRLYFRLRTRVQRAGSTFNMKYLPVQDFEPVTRALNFNTPDCNVTGGCDLYTTKSTGSDKKLYRNIDKDLSSQHDALVKLGASLSPPDRAQMLATSPNMQLFSTSSAFGPLSDLSSRRTFAYLIATLNASHPHYDFSHVLRPGDFKRERNLRRVMVNLDSILQNVRPGFEAASFDSSLGSDLDSVWGPQCWSLIDKEMRLNECTLFSYHPDPDPFEEDESAIWAVHYFFFNRALKRVAYLYVRVVPVVSSTSPTLTPIKVGQHKRQTDFAADGAAKRARYWLGDRQAELVPPFEDDEDPQDDGLFWNRGEDGDLVPFSDDDYFEELEDDGELEDGGDLPLDQGHDRMMSEDVAGELEM